MTAEPVTTDHEQDLEAHFEDTIARDRRIEPRDWMPPKYRVEHGQADRAARALGDHRHAARGQLDHPRPLAPPQGDPAGQGPGQGRPRHVPVQRGRDARGRPGRPHPAAHREPPEVLLDLQLPRAQLRRRRRHRLAGGRGRDLQPGPALPLLLRPLRAGDDPHLQGGVVPPAAGLRAADDDDARHPGPARHGPGRGRPHLVAVADDVRPARRGLAQHRPVDALGRQAAHQRRAPPALRRHDGPAGRAARRHPARSRPALERRTRPLRLRPGRLGRAQGRHRGQRPLQRPARRPPPGGPRRGRLGPRGRPRPRGETARSRPRQNQSSERSQPTVGGAQ